MASLDAMSSVVPVLDPKELRPLLHSEIDRLPDEHLEKAHRALLEIEMKHLAGDLDMLFGEAQSVGRLTADSIAETITEYRKEHPYRP